ncbi:MAG TPA: radical SAM protein [Anaerolineae bacterium]|nr:radical SAM protein [Anaerolineae bacterium]
MRVAGLEELQARLQRDLRPWGASLEITRRCNLGCVHCLRGPSRQDDGLFYAQVCQVLDQLVDLGCMRLSFTGGEPFTRPDFVPILEYAWQKRIASVILTNGTLITSTLADTLLTLHVHEIQVSLYAASSQVHETVTRVPGSFSATLGGIQRLTNQGLRVKVMMPVLSLNIQEVSAVRKLCDQQGATFQRSLLLFPRDDGSPAPLDFVASDEQLCRLAEEEVRCDWSASDATRGMEFSRNRPLCTAGIQQIGIGSDGSVYPCGALRLPAGNIRRQELARIWHTSPVLEELRRARPAYPIFCASCQVREYCSWCPGLSLMLEGDMTVPNSQDCRRTRIFRGGVDCGGIWRQAPHRARQGQCYCDDEETIPEA